MTKRHLDDPEGAEALEKAYKKARKAYKKDPSDETLKKKKNELQKAWEDAVVAASTDVPTTKEQESSPADVSHSDDNVKSDDESNELPANEGNENSSSSDSVKTLEREYQAALAAFKADKTNKDLRRAKTAARRALDEAIVMKEAGEQLVCRDCSQMFIFPEKEVLHYQKKGWTDRPKRCKACSEASKFRRMDRDKLDGGKNMCRSFQRGQCKYGEKCKFSHNPEFAGQPKSEKMIEEDTDSKQNKGSTKTRKALE
jgi:ribosomal protein S20